jgi:mannitol 2-dehydrogenase
MTTAATPVRLNSATLGGLATAVSVPSYDRARICTGIVHFGVGGFHRAHQAMYLDRLHERGEAFDWGICGVGVLPGDARMRDVMRKQDCLYTLSETAADGSWRTRVVGSIVEYLYAPDDPEKVIEKLANEQIRIVSLTVTEGGYNFDATTGEFDARNPAIMADLAPGAVPSTTFGLVVEALARRRARGISPFTVMSCDNIQGNGHIARDTFTAFARLRDPELGDWIEREVAFPNSMVDRITPATTPDTIEQVRQRYSIEDDWPVATEPFTQWVLEDCFTAGRPAFENVDVQVVDDVEPYELMKLRLLNASHQAMCYFGYLAGYRYVHEVAQDAAFAKFLLRYMTREGQPTLRAVAGVDLTEYERTLIERFSNPEIRDTVARLCAESSDRIPKWLLPVVRHQLAHDGEIECAAAVVASWARYAEATDEQGNPIDIVDPLRETLVPIALRQREEPTAFIANRKLFGDLVDEPRFVDAYLRALEALHTTGARATVQALADG